MKHLKGTKTLENLMKSFAGESQARNRYTFYATVAKKEGFNQIEKIFLETADNEKEHAKRFFNAVTDNLKEPIVVDINASYPASIGSTLENLKAAAAGEKEEYTEIYPSFADVADKEGFPEIAFIWRKIADVEVHHGKRYETLAHNVEKNMVFKKDVSVKWICKNCGHIHEGKEALDKCPTCLHPKAYFELLCDNF